MKTLVAALALMSLTSAGAFAACTQDDLVKKTQEFSTKLQAFAQKDSKKANEVSTKISSEASEKTSKIKTIDDSCAYYDDLIKMVSQ
jgi:hypothetical protein